MVNRVLVAAISVMALAFVSELEGQRRYPDVAKRYCTPYAYQQVLTWTSPPNFGDGICEVVYFRGEPRTKREFTTMDGKFLLLDYSTGSAKRQYTLHWELGDDGSGNTMGWTVVGVEWP